METLIKKTTEPLYMQDPNPLGPIIYMNWNTDYAYCIVYVIIGECCMVMYDQFITIGNNISPYNNYIYFILKYIKS